LKKLPLSFYLQTDVVAVARLLLGKLLVTSINGKTTVVRICETEAYSAVADKASHAYNGRFTNRNQYMHQQGGVAYVYLCYGIHQLFNVVTNQAGVPDAVLIRAGIPVNGVETMIKRCSKALNDTSLTRGPGNLARAMGIDCTQSGISLLGSTFYLAEDDTDIAESEILSSPRIGVAYAGADALLPYRFYLANCIYVSGSRNQAKR
jgi:DNA-3-methyladenine glycosylase